MIKLEYIPFPISYLPSLYDDKVKTIDKIFYYGIYKLSIERLKLLKMEDVIRQLIYSKYQHTISVEIDSLLTGFELSYFGENEDYKGFSKSDGSWNPEFQESLELEELFKAEPNLYSICWMYHKVEDTLKLLKLNKSKASVVIENGKELIKNDESNGCYSMVSIELLKKFRKLDKNEYDIDQFVAFLAIKSIIGTKEYCKTNKELILARMLGFNSSKDIMNTTKSNTNSKRILEKYSKRYHFDKLVETLQLNWNLKHYSYHTRGIYFGMIKLEKLIFSVETEKHKGQILKNEQKALREKALFKIQNGEINLSDLNSKKNGKW